VESSSGSGSVIAVRDEQVSNKFIHILTAAHVVADSTYISVQRNTDYFESEKFQARVVAQFNDTDLALLRIEDPHVVDEFQERIEPMRVASPGIMPNLRSKVNVVGYPVGGDRVSVTEGVVSRVDIAKYSHSGRFACSFTVDAAINAGNSGGPIVDPVSGEVIGVAFQKLVGSGVENQGHGVPPYLIWRFLNSLNQARDELPCLGISIQPLESAALRQCFGASNGVLVNRTHNPTIEQHDVIMGVDGHAIDNQGLTQFLGRRIHFTALLHQKFAGDSVKLTVLRKKERISLHATLMPASSVELVPGLQYARRPDFLVIGGLVFQPLSQDYLQGWNERDRPSHLQDLLNRGRLEGSKTQAVVLTNVLAARCNAGYSSGWVGGPVLKAVNGEEIHNIEHLGQVLDRLTDKYIKFTLSGFVDDQLIVLDRAEVLQDEKEIQTIYEIPRMRSF
jgi:S1-C subfamily serine protease